MGGRKGEKKEGETDIKVLNIGQSMSMKICWSASQLVTFGLFPCWLEVLRVDSVREEGGTSPNMDTPPTGFCMEKVR